MSQIDFFKRQDSGNEFNIFLRKYTDLIRSAPMAILVESKIGSNELTEKKILKIIFTNKNGQIAYSGCSGRDNVISFLLQLKAAMKNYTGELLGVVDADFFPIPTPPSDLVILPCYEIENYLISKDSVIKIFETALIDPTKAQALYEQYMKTLKNIASYFASNALIAIHEPRTTSYITKTGDTHKCISRLVEDLTAVSFSNLQDLYNALQVSNFNKNDLQTKTNEIYSHITNEDFFELNKAIKGKYHLLAICHILHTFDRSKLKENWVNIINLYKEDHSSFNSLLYKNMILHSLVDFHEDTSICTLDTRYRTPFNNIIQKIP